MSNDPINDAVTWVIDTAEKAWQAIVSQNIPPGPKEESFGTNTFFVEVTNPFAKPGLGQRFVAITTNLKKSDPAVQKVIAHFEKERTISGIRLAKRDIHFGEVKTKDGTGKESTHLCIYIL